MMSGRKNKNMLYRKYHYNAFILKHSSPGTEMFPTDAIQAPKLLRYRTVHRLPGLSILVP